MKVAGIIAEYNPFHNGHQYQIDQVRAQTGADYVIAIMSGNFLQRGVPAIVDKHTRTDMALHGGADLVLELPCQWATASAEQFARGGVTLLAQTGIVDVICYGVEQANDPLMHRLTQLLNNAPEAYDEKLCALQKQGLSYPAARAHALSCLLNDFDESSVLSFLSTPNNILAVEYEKAILGWNTSHARNIEGHGIRRIGSGYHDTVLHKEFSSATAIRSLLLQNKTQTACSALAGQVPPRVYELLTRAAANNDLLDADDFSAALYARLWTYRREGYTQFADCSLELSNKIINHLDSYTSFTSFAALLKTRDTTYTRICRVLTHILLDIRRNDCETFEPSDACLRILGFRRDASALLSALKKHACAPLVTKMADAPQVLTDSTAHLLAQDIAAADLYRSIRSIRRSEPLPNEFTQPIVILS